MQRRYATTAINNTSKEAASSINKNRKRIVIVNPEERQRREAEKAKELASLIEEEAKLNLHVLIFMHKQQPSLGN